MNFKAIFLVAISLFLVSCSWANAFRSEVASRGQDAADQALESTMWSLCKATPVGAINRRFITDEEIDAYRGLCPDNLAAPTTDIE